MTETGYKDLVQFIHHELANPLRFSIHVDEECGLKLQQLT